MKFKQKYYRIFIHNSALLLLLTIYGCHKKQPSLLGENTFNVRDFGAKGDSIHLETLFIQAAIDACALHGGTVFFPEGTYRTGTVFLKNNVTLHISKGAVILGSTELKDYPRLSPKYEFYGSSWRDQSLIYGENLHDIAIEGEGAINGQGASFIIKKNKKPFRYMDRPYGLWFINCKNIRIENIHLRNSAFWMQHYLACDHVRIKGISVFNHSNKNNDMIDIDGCHDVVISDCTGDSDDDGITLKSTSGRMNENITISNCTVSSHCNAIKLGTESSGGFKNINISNCTIKPSAIKTTIYGEPAGDGGIAIELVDGGIMDSVFISNIKIDGPQVPLFVRLGNRARKYKDNMDMPPIGILRNIFISDITATGANNIGSSITGLIGHPVENIVLNNIKIKYSGGGTNEDASNIVEELPGKYPEGNMFGVLPSYGLFIRHAKNISVHNLELSFENKEERPAIFCEDVEGFDIINLRADIGAGVEPCIVLKQVEATNIEGEVCRVK
ncbi:MAG TPA: glycoside hydrolase family 28 protein [Bacteroidetes bacterium]|nr:glycoside hydrolase family 28 protein [Bacteroidota bacterium]